MATGKYGSASFGVLLVDGYDFLAAKVKTFTHKITAQFEDSTGLGDSTMAKTPTGLSKLEITQGGAFFDDSTNGAHALLSTSTGTNTARTVCAAFAGNTIGKEFLGCSGAYGMAYEVVSSGNNLTKANVTYDVSGTLDRGVIVQNSTAKTIDWNGHTDGNFCDFTLEPQVPVAITSNTLANPTIVTTSVPHGLAAGHIILISGNITSSPSINGPTTYAVTVISTTTFSIPVNCTTGGTGGSFVRCNSLNGGRGYQMVSAMSGLTGHIGKIRDSPDETTYGDLLTFTNVTAAPAAETLTNVADTVVDRYLVYNGDVTGSGSITPFVGFARY